MGRPTREQAQAWTQELLDAARSLFCERGYAGATIDELAVRLRCSKHTIYRRFPDRQALFIAVVDRDVTSFVTALDASCAATSVPLERLQAMARTYFKFGASRDYAGLYAAMALEAATSAQLRTHAVQWAQEALVPLRRETAAAMPGGDVNEKCDILIDLLDGAANRLRLRNDPNYDDETIFSDRWDVFLRIAE